MNGLKGSFRGFIPTKVFFYELWYWGRPKSKPRMLFLSSLEPIRGTFSRKFSEALGDLWEMARIDENWSDTVRIGLLQQITKNNVGNFPSEISELRELSKQHMYTVLNHQDALWLSNRIIGAIFSAHLFTVRSKESYAVCSATMCNFMIHYGLLWFLCGL